MCLFEEMMISTNQRSAMSAIVGGADACRCAVALTSSVMSKRNGSQRTLLNTYVKYVHRRSELSRWAQRAQTAAERHTGTLLSWRRQRREARLSLLCQIWLILSNQAVIHSATLNKSKI